MPPQVTEIANGLAGKDDRYLFLFTAVILFFGLIYLVRYFMTGMEKMQTRSTEMAERMILVCERNNTIVSRCERTIDNANQTAAVEREKVLTAQVLTLSKDLATLTENKRAVQTASDVKAALMTSAPHSADV